MERRKRKSTTPQTNTVKRPKVILPSLTDLIQELDVSFTLMEEMTSTWLVCNSSNSSFCIPITIINTDQKIDENPYKFKLEFTENLPGLNTILTHPKWQQCLLSLRFVPSSFTIRFDVTINNRQSFEAHLQSIFTSLEYKNFLRLYNHDCLTLTYSLQNSPLNNLTLYCHLEEPLLKGSGLPDDLPSSSTCLLNQSFLKKYLFSSKDAENIINNTELPLNMYTDVEQSIGTEISSVVPGLTAKIMQFYKFVHTHQLSQLTFDLSPLPESIPLLTAQLLDYQKNGIQWMLYKEKAEPWRQRKEEEERDKTLHLLWREVTLCDGMTKLYYNPFNGKISSERYSLPQFPKGGILADEMGLGKTVEILTLILIHTYPYMGVESFIKDYVTSYKEEKSLREEREEEKGDKNTSNGKENGIEESTSRIEKDKENETVQDKMVEQERGEIMRDSNNEVEMQLEEGHDGQEKDTERRQPRPQNDNKIEMEEFIEGKEVITCTCSTVKTAIDLSVQCDVCSQWYHTKCADFDEKMYSDFVCVACLLEKPIPCGTTLIIVPETLLHQWLEEITKHTDIQDSDIIVYSGVSQHYINPLHLALNTIVLITYEVIRKELDRVHHLEFKQRLRRQHKFRYSPSPLCAVKWWRIVLDEAQMVETSSSKAAEMTHKLSAVNRWCVTGTPIQRDLRDLYGLVYFLDYHPYCIRQWWDRFIWQPYCLEGDSRPVVQLFSHIMWRNSKEDVSEQLCWPALEEKVHCLSLSPVESYYYKRQEDQCYEIFENVSRQLMTESGSTNVSNLDRTFISKLMGPLYKLRLACCHPQLVKKGYIRFTSIHKSYLSMDDLLTKMITQAKQEGRESLRQLVSAINGIAGIQILQKKYKTAVDTYREAIVTWKEYENDYDCDRLQRIHTMENLASLIKEGHSSHSRTLYDDRLNEIASTLRTEYSKKSHDQVATAVYALNVAADKMRTALKEAYVCQNDYLLTFDSEEKGEGEGEGDDKEREKEENKQREEIEENHGNKEEEIKEVDEEEEETEQEVDEEEDELNLEENDVVKDKQLAPFTTPLTSIKEPPAHWWELALEWSELHYGNQLFELLEYMRITEIAKHLTPFIHMFSSSCYDYYLTTQIDKLQAERENILSTLNTLTKSTSQTTLEQVTKCHLGVGRPDSNYTYTCVFCVAEKALKSYENTLFGGNRFDESTRSLSIVEVLLKSTLSFLTSRGVTGCPSGLIESGKSFMKYMETLRNEFKYMTHLWMASEQQVRALDELNMASKRFQLLEEETNEALTNILLTRAELPFKLFQFEFDAKNAKNSLEKNKRQLTYLENLSKVTQNEEETTSCPICVGPLKQNNEWAVLSCGHSYCFECLYTLLSHRSPSPDVPLCQQIESVVSKKIHFSCPLCRESLISSDINFINKKNTVEKPLPVELKGSHSTKIAAVTSTLLKIKYDSPCTKSLVFSSSVEVLKLISRALDENYILFTFLTTKKEFQTNLKEFKTNPNLNVLLMSITSGSKGLNIVEATQVLLVEPFLNVGAELQSIGRVYRMGQTKPVTVHKFYVENTVEQRIREMMCSTGDVAKFLTANDEYNFTVDDLKTLFVRNYHNDST